MVRRARAARLRVRPQGRSQAPRRRGATSTTDDELAGFEAFAGAGDAPPRVLDRAGAVDGLRRPGRPRRARPRKVDQVVSAGAALVVLAFDDIPFGGGPQGEAHARVTTWLREHLGDRADLSVVPTEYVGIRPSPYLEALAAGMPDDVPIGWTGRAVLNDTITVADAEARADSLGGRPPMLWDNYPVNDARDGRPALHGTAPRPRARADRRLRRLLRQPDGAAARQQAARWRPRRLRAGRGPRGGLEGRPRRTSGGWPSPRRATPTPPTSRCAAAAAGDLGAGPPAVHRCGVVRGPRARGRGRPVGHPDPARRPARARAPSRSSTASAPSTPSSAWRRAGRRRAGRPVTVFGPRCSIRLLLGQADDGTWRVEPGVGRARRQRDRRPRRASPSTALSARASGLQGGAEELADVVEARFEHLVVERVAAEHALEERRRRRSSRGWRRGR